MRIRTLSRRFVPAFLIPLLTVIALFAYPTIGPVGMTILKSGVQAGYVIFASPDGNAYAIDTKGKVARKWPSPEPNTTLGYTRPLANGNLLARLQPMRSPSGANGANAEVTGGDTVIEMTQDGREVWKYTDRVRSLQHDQERKSDGNTLFVCSKDLNVPSISRKLLTDDCLIEVNPAGKIVWEWQTSDHVDEFEFPQDVKDQIMAGYGPPEGPRLAVGAPPPTKGFDWGHMNAASPIPETAGHTDSRFKAGNIIASYRNLNTIVIVDRDTKKIVWKSVNLTIGQHNPHMLPAGLSGTGHILVFDNGNNNVNENPRHKDGRPNSRILEINPLDMSIAWEYNAEKSNRPIWSFFSHYISSAQRQPNGNTLICEGANGRIFEVTPDGEIVWEYVNPFPNVTGKVPNSTIFRAAKVEENWLKR